MAAASKGSEHLVDLDYGFTPATNVLQLSRIALKPDQRAEVPVAWFDLDSASLTELPQSYERRSEACYWYEAPTVPYQSLPGNRPQRVRSVLSGTLATRGVKSDGPSRHTSAASRSMRKARAAGSVCRPIARP